MASDRDIYRTASVLIRDHGDDANIVAAMRADELLEYSDLDGSAVWRRARKAVKEIPRQERRSEESLH